MKVAGSERKVVIVGGGYAGTTCAVTLGKSLAADSDVEILLVEPDPCQQALSELDLVAVGPPRPQFCELWHPTVFKNLPVTVCYERVTAVHADRKVCVVGENEEVPYWRLVLATGAVPFIPPVPGLAERATTMWSVEDAQALQERIDDAFRSAAKLADGEARRKLLSFTVVGGGATGVEIVGTLAQMLPRRARDHGIDPGPMQVSLIEGRPEILYDLPAPQRGKAVERLRKLGATVYTGSMVERVTDEAVVLADGTSVASNVLVWAGGAKADPHAADWGLTIDSIGRILVDANLKAEGHDDIYAIGDVCAARHPKTNKVLPMLAQMAIQEGPHIAKSIVSESLGGSATPFEPHMRGEFVSVGPSWGVGWMYRWSLTGLPAIVMKRITYVKYWLQVGGIPLAWKRTREMLSMHR